MKYKEQGKYLPSAADWQVACGPNPTMGTRAQNSLFQQWTAFSLTTISWVLSHVRGVASVLAIEGILYPDQLPPGSSAVAMLAHLALQSCTLSYSTGQCVVLPQLVCPLGRKSTVILPTKVKSGVLRSVSD